MLSILYCTLGFLALNARTTFSTPVSYDQRQTGDVNVQIHLKDVQVVALVDSELLEDYTDYDYAYDYSDFTIKPIIKPTTSSSSLSSSSIKPWNTWPTKPSSTSSTTTSSSIGIDSQFSASNNVQPETATTPIINQQSINASNIDNTKNSTIYNLGNIHKNKTDIKLRNKDNIESDILNEDDILKIEKEQSVDSLEISHENSKKSCPTGYALNKKGRCRSTQIRRRISLVPLSMKLSSKLSEKGRFTVRKDLPIRVYKSEPRH